MLKKIPIEVAALIAALILFLIGIGVGWFAGSNVKNFTLWGEVSKALLQVGLVVGVGAAIKFLLDDTLRRREHERQERERRSTLIKGFISRSGNIYREAKGCRRKLRALGLTRKGESAPAYLSPEQWQGYAIAMQALNETQLRLEELKIESATNPDLKAVRENACPLPDCPSHGESVTDHLRSMEKYIRRVTGEFEDISGKRANRKPVKDGFDDLVKLRDFTDGGEQGERKFKAEFAGKHERLIRLLHGALAQIDANRALTQMEK